MADQAQVSKLVPYVLTGPPEDSVSVTKLVMYVWAEPGDAEDTSNRQGHVCARIIRKES
jgi:hypothetical protein